MSLTKHSLAGNDLIIPGQGEFIRYITAGDRKIADFFLQRWLMNLSQLSLHNGIVVPALQATYCRLDTEAWHAGTTKICRKRRAQESYDLTVQ